MKYINNFEELYDHSIDPSEWTNLAVQSEYAEVINEHKIWLPVTAK